MASNHLSQSRRTKSISHRSTVDLKHRQPSRLILILSIRRYSSLVPSQMSTKHLMLIILKVSKKSPSQIPVSIPPNTKRRLPLASLRLRASRSILTRPLTTLLAVKCGSKKNNMTGKVAERLQRERTTPILLGISLGKSAQEKVLPRVINSNKWLDPKSTSTLWVRILAQPKQISLIVNRLEGYTMTVRY